MERGNHAHEAERQIDGAAQVHADCLNICAAEVHNFGNAHDGCARAFQNVVSVADMVAVRVRHEDIICLNVIGLNRRERVARQEGVEENFGRAVVEQKARVPVVIVSQQSEPPPFKMFACLFCAAGDNPCRQQKTAEPVSPTVVKGAGVREKGI